MPSHPLRPLTRVRDLSEEEILQIVNHSVDASNRSLDVYQQIGEMHAMVASSTRNTEASARDAAASREAAERCETILRRAYPSTPPPPGPYRRRAESLVEVSDADTTGVRELKVQLAPIVEAHAAELAVAASDAKRMRKLAAVLGVIVGIGAVAALLWAIFKFAVRNV